MSLSCIASHESTRRACENAPRIGPDRRGSSAAMDVYEALYTTRAMRRCRPDPIPRGRAGAHPRRRDPRAERRQHAELALHARRRPRGSRSGSAPIYRDCLAQALGDGLQGPHRRRRTRRPTIPRTRRCCESSGRRSTSPTTSRSTRCCCSASCSSTRPAARSSRRRGRRCSPRAPRASARRSRRCSCSTSTTCSRSSVYRSRKAGSSLRA